MKRSPDTDERDGPSRQDDDSKNIGAEEDDIDQILADSFPASDPPSWTLGVTETPQKTVRTRKGWSG